jgi:hypothetical protein
MHAAMQAAAGYSPDTTAACSSFPSARPVWLSSPVLLQMLLLLLQESSKRQSNGHPASLGQAVHARQYYWRLVLLAWQQQHCPGCWPLVHRMLLSAEQQQPCPSGRWLC